MKILNAFSLNMLQSLTSIIEVEEISLDQAKDIVTDNGIDSAVGHSDTAAVFTEQLGVEVPVNRATIALEKGEKVLVGQYKGPRLPEGCTSLPDGASINWCLVSVD
jgi:hypothetical protein